MVQSTVPSTSGATATTAMAAVGLQDILATAGACNTGWSTGSSSGACQAAPAPRDTLDAAACVPVAEAHPALGAAVTCAAAASATERAATSSSTSSGKWSDASRATLGACQTAQARRRSA